MRSDPRVKAAIREVLKVSPGKTIAQSLRGMKILRRLDAEQLADLAAREGESVMNRALLHDKALEAIAAAYSKVPASAEGLAEKYDMQELVDIARKAAQTGSEKGFKDVFRAIDETWDANRAAGLGRPLDELRELAGVMADFPEVSRKMLGDNQRKRLQRMRSPRSRELFLFRILLERLKNNPRPQSIEDAEK